ncbi:hypothetical protein Godav_020333 [Gossypium davidsonii]|uniref:Uncharacterized protein n=1 Tax=Gossypium davidsonii TaxID=34287 RepID=A0A7J8R302_GOSDV|nr:hypothetical protein [Gossypium davidsonii]
MASILLIDVQSNLEIALMETLPLSLILQHII